MREVKADDYIFRSGDDGTTFEAGMSSDLQSFEVGMPISIRFGIRHPWWVQCEHPQAAARAKDHQLRLIQLYQSYRRR